MTVEPPHKLTARVQKPKPKALSSQLPASPSPMVGDSIELRSEAYCPTMSAVSECRQCRRWGPKRWRHILPVVWATLGRNRLADDSGDSRHAFAPGWKIPGSGPFLRPPTDFRTAPRDRWNCASCMKISRCDKVLAPCCAEAAVKMLNHVHCVFSALEPEASLA